VFSPLWIIALAAVFYVIQDLVFTLYRVIFDLRILRGDEEDREERRQATREELEERKNVRLNFERDRHLAEERAALLNDYDRIAEVLVQRGCDPQVVTEVLDAAFNQDPSTFGVIQLHPGDASPEDRASLAGPLSPVPPPPNGVDDGEGHED